MTSYHQRHMEGRQKAKRDRPSPLRIVKRSRGNDYDADARGDTNAVIYDSDSEVSSIIDRTKRLQIFKRRTQHQTPTARTFWASSVDLRHPQTRSWEEAVARCRGLLRRSTPNIRNYKRYLTIGRSRSAHTESGRRLSSTCSSQPSASADYYRSSSTSSEEMDSTSVDDMEYQHSCESSGILEPQSPLGTSNQLSPRQMSQNTRTYILSPRVVATPQQKELDGTESSVWVAVEISGKLSQISTAKTPKAPETQHDIVAGTYINHKLDRFFDFGCLYDLTMEVSAVPGTAILDVVHEQSWPTTIYAGTSVLVMVHIRLHTTTRGTEMGHARPKSNELMEELERQLGDVQTQLMNIRVLYHHSAFPEIVNVELPQSGLCHLQSRMETTATAAIAWKSRSSVWSPKSKAPQNSLFPLLVQHWGDEKAISLQRRISDSQTTQVKDSGCDTIDSAATSRDNEALGMTFGFDMDPLHGAAPELQRYLLDGTSLNIPQAIFLSRNQDVGLGTKLQEVGASPSSPVRDMYYFGERALRALAPSPTSESNNIQTNPTAGEQTSLGKPELKHKDSNFWDWGSWF
ncbi:hypothetical protein NOR_02198 [Metarhizium rileyi]|uniref:Uncharacterized protein n=1 Tax=Metarhizium rileyi (strain RCEF 4871) TaxID=1649241 RepID=A0A162JQQ9_METRR|nr:hypothetical protein NOR_02198 [Metarhizium rileyi RCEF 4871]